MPRTAMASITAFAKQRKRFRPRPAPKVLKSSGKLRELAVDEVIKKVLTKTKIPKRKRATHSPRKTRVKSRGKRTKLRHIFAPIPENATVTQFNTSNSNPTPRRREQISPLSSGPPLARQRRRLEEIISQEAAATSEPIPKPEAEPKPEPAPIPRIRMQEMQQKMKITSMKSSSGRVVVEKREEDAKSKLLKESAKLRLSEIRNRRLRRRKLRSQAKAGPVLGSAKPLSAQNRSKDEEKPTLAEAKENLAPKQVEIVATSWSQTQEISPEKREARRLPTRFLRLIRVFGGLDTALNIALARRPSSAYFEKLKPQVEISARTRFTKRDLATLLAVYPEAYAVAYKESLGVASTLLGNCNNSSPELMIRFGRGAGGEEGEGGGGKVVWLNERILAERRRELENQLYARVEKVHDTWLKDNDTSITSDDLKDLNTWHFEFEREIENLVEEIPPAALPEVPNSQSQTRRRREEELKAIRAPKVGPSAAAVEKEKAFLVANGVPKGLRGIDIGLVAKVRLRDAQTRADKALGGPEQREKLSIMSQLSYCSDLMRTTLRARSRRAMRLSELIPLLVQTHRNRTCPPTEKSMDRQIRMIAEIVPGFAALKVSVRGDGEILRIDFKFPIGNIRKAISMSLEKERKILEKIDREARMNCRDISTN
ncbi:hypothetical protein AAMO2058_001003100 [Amorphochlora amoebiformis]